MTETRRSVLAPMLRWAGNPLDWNEAEKALLGALAVFPFTIWWGLCEYYALLYPQFAPYIDRSFLPWAFRFQIALIAGWMAIIIAAAFQQRCSPTSRVLPVVGVQFYFIGFGIASYYTGPYTCPYAAAVGLAGAIVINLLWGLRVALAGVFSFGVILVGTTIAEQAGIIPYAPLLLNAVFDEEPMVRDYLFVGAIPTLTVFATPLLISWYAIARWHDREEKLAQTSRQLSQANDIISRYVASQLAAQIRAGNYDVGKQHVRRKLTLFFSDIKEFAAIADRMEPEDLSVVLNEYLSEMAQIGERYGGTIDKFIGDAIMIFFGAPVATNDRDHALRTVQMAMEMQERMVTLRDKWHQEGVERPFDIRIGINTGQASIGSFGSGGRMDYTAIGRQVNFAARLQTHCEPGKILLSQSTWVLVRDDVECIPKGELQVKGVSAPVRVYEVVGGHVGPRDDLGVDSAGEC